MSLVLKFGGTSISKLGFEVIVNEIQKNKGKKIVIVLSALANTTNLVVKFLTTYNLKFIDQIRHNHIKFTKDLNLNCSILNDKFKILDSLSKSIILNKDNYFQKNELLSIGEYIATYLFVEYAKSYNLNYKLEDSSKFIFSKNSFEMIKDTLYMKGSFYCNFTFDDTYDVLVCQGFVASTNDNYKCTLSRGGSDTTASLIAESLKAERLEIWTDVDGIYNANPSIIKDANIVKYLDYDLSQELSTMGAKVLHPYCIKPCQRANIPIHIKNTYGSNINNTIVGSKYYNEYMLMIDRNNIVFQITSLDMWNDYGFVSHIFECFKKESIDVNIITTSQFSVMVTTNELDMNKINNYKDNLSKYYEVKVYNKCSLISIVGKNILHFGKFNKIFENIKKYNSLLMSHFSSNNMCVSFVLPDNDGLNLYNEFFYKFFMKKKDDNCKEKWWYKKKNDILNIVSKESNIYLYNLDVIREKCTSINCMKSIDKKFYAMKANNNLEVLREIYKNGFGFECVSIDEVKFIKNNFNNSQVLFTPNYCNISEYRFIFDNNLEETYVTVDNYEVLRDNYELFNGKQIMLRLDMNMGDGHNKKVITEGIDSKFGLELSKLEMVMNFCNEKNIYVIGFHSHRGSNINNIDNWINAYNKLKLIASRYNINIVNIGGGFGTKLKLEDFQNLDLKLDKDINIWIEPGRYLVADAGILISHVNLIKEKGDNKFIGLDTGMNSLMRPALYDSYHSIYNLSKIDSNEYDNYNIVGPICESGDIFGKNRLLPKTEHNDIMLIDEAGAYGYTMANEYNMRAPAKEIIFNKEYNKINEILNHY